MYPEEEMAENLASVDDLAETPQAEDDIVRAAQESPAAFGPLFNAYAPRIYRYSLHRLGNVADAEDVTSRTFTDAMQNLSQYRPRKNGTFGGWLFTIARRRCTDHFRESEPLPLPDVDLVSGGDAPLEQAISRDDDRKLQRLLQRLDETELELLRLRFTADLTYKQMGDALGKSEAAAKMSLIRLMKRMRLMWEENDE